MIRAWSALVQPLISDLMRDRLLDYDIVQMDETPVQVLKEAGRHGRNRNPTCGCSAVVRRMTGCILYDYDPDREAVLFHNACWQATRGIYRRMGMRATTRLVAGNGLKQLGCMAHARRRFDEAVKAQGKRKRRGKAWRGLSFIQALYRVEKQARSMTPQQRYAYRNVQAKPILDNLRSWLDDSLPQVPPKGAVGNALRYLHEQWDKLTRYLDDGRLEIDNNLCENAVRPFVMGRKAWLFSDSVAGVSASANLYSLLETAKAHGLEPYAILARGVYETTCPRQR